MSYIYKSAELLSGLLGDQEIEQLFCVEEDLGAMLKFESALAQAQAATGLIAQASADHISEKARQLQIDMPALTQRVARDGLAPPGLVAQLRESLDADHARALHTGATSQDLVDTSLMMRLSRVVPVLQSRIADIETKLRAHSDPSIELMARTRMQRALPISLAHKISNWTQPLSELIQSTPTQFALQLGGPEGALNAMGDHPQAIVEHMARSLNLYAPVRCWHTDRRGVLALCNWATDVTTALGKIGQDIALMAQNEVAEVTLEGGGSSSAMAHKNNPIGAETLVAVARANAVAMGGMQQAALHENERSGAGWTLEWMLLPQVFVNAAASTRTAAALIDSIKFNR